MKTPDEAPDHVPAWRVWLAPLGLLIGIVAVFMLGRAGMITGLDDALAKAGMLADSPWGLPALLKDWRFPLKIPVHSLDSIAGIIILIIKMSLYQL